MYHRFPQNRALNKIWEERCKRKYEFNVKNAVICSEHFTEDDYERDLRNELLGLPLKKLLKKDAVPTLSLPEFENTTKKTSGSKKGTSKKDNSESLMKSDEFDSMSSEMNSLEGINEYLELKLLEKEEEISNLKSTNRRLNNRISLLERKNETLLKKIRMMRRNNVSPKSRVKIY
ncbi:hypothetical protein AVEN_241703-1 [Araneus ventricosus]|uniref:THAP-type domain-containing protein n=1 Tax=Araneus ventricosus TaxID=182803 RepID=A0A4Y2NB67_ARAVE|nr:hypothetical protein AVEN_241703-1 [Araneus ventricosus]